MEPMGEFGKTRKDIGWDCSKRSLIVSDINVSFGSNAHGAHMMQCHYLVLLAWNIHAFILSFKPQLSVFFLWLIYSIPLVQATGGWNFDGLHSPATFSRRCKFHLLVHIIEKIYKKRRYYLEPESKGRVEGDECRGQRIIAAGTSSCVSHWQEQSLWPQKSAGPSIFKKKKKKKTQNTHLLPSCIHSFFT